MGKSKKAPHEEEAMVVERAQEASLAEKIRSQVLATIGRPPHLDRVEVSRHHNGNYRVNIWEQPEPDEHLAVKISACIRWSYYLKVSDTGEIVNSNPPLKKLSFLA
jgi:hypothetical protein